MSGSEPPSRWLGQIGGLLAEQLAADGCIVYLVDQAAGQLIAVAVSPEPEGGLPDLRLPLGFGVTGRVAVDGVAAVLADGVTVIDGAAEEPEVPLQVLVPRHAQ